MGSTYFGSTPNCGGSRKELSNKRVNINTLKYANEQYEQTGWLAGRPGRELHKHAADESSDPGRQRACV